MRNIFNFNSSVLHVFDLLLAKKRQELSLRHTGWTYPDAHTRMARGFGGHIAAVASYQTASVVL